MEKRLKIFYQYSDKKIIQPINGDFITELGIMTALSQFADVYYSGNKFNLDAKNYGMSNYIEDISSRVDNSYDIYYVRANKKVFLRIPKNKPKIWMAIPFDYECYSKATAIFVFTKAWEDSMKQDKCVMHDWIPEEHRIGWDKVITVHQVLGSHFVPLRNSEITQKIRKKIDSDFIIGYFGSMSGSNYPSVYLKTLTTLFKKYQNKKIKFFFGVKNAYIPGRKGVIKQEIDYVDMPYWLSACDLIIFSQSGFGANIAGSLKVLEAQACGVPILLEDLKAKRESLGDDYPFYMPPGSMSGEVTKSKKAMLVEKIDEIIYMYEEKKNDIRLISKKIAQRSFYYKIEESIKRLKQIFEIIANGHN